MKRDPVEIVDEYLKHESPRIRRNAVTALGVIGNEKGVKKLVAVAATDIDADVQDAAVREIATLEQRSKDVAAAEFSEGLKNTERDKIYALLGKIRAAGSDLAVAGEGRINWLRCAWHLFRQTYPLYKGIKRVVFHLKRAARPAFAGCIISVVVFALYLGGLAKMTTLSGTLSHATLSDCMSLGLVGYVFAIIATYRTTPFALHFNPVAGAITETVGAVLSCLVALVALMIFLLLTGETSLTEMDADLMFVLFFLPLCIGITRLGTVLAPSFSPSNKINVAIESAVGAATGVAAVTICCSMFPRTAEQLWSAAVLVMIIAAITFASIDGEVATRIRSSSIWQAVVSGGIVVLVATAMVITVTVPTAVKIAGTTTHRHSLKKNMQAIKVDMLPYELILTPEKNEEMVGSLEWDEGKEDSGEELIINLLQSPYMVLTSGSKILRSTSGNAASFQDPIDLTKGKKYSILIYDRRAMPNHDLSFYNALSNTLAALRATFSQTPSAQEIKPAKNITLRLAFQEPGTFTPTANRNSGIPLRRIR